MSDEPTRLPVRFRERPDLQVLRRGDTLGGCGHHGPYTVNECEAEVTCDGCGEKLNPMWVLQRLANQEHQWHRLRATYQDEMQRLEQRRRTKCQHCGKLTRISHR